MHQPAITATRRHFVRSAVAGSLLMPGLLSELLAADGAIPRDAADPWPRAAHFPAKAKSVIFLFMSGGVSHIDSFDPKPQLIADHGKQVTLDHPEIKNRPGYEEFSSSGPIGSSRRAGKAASRSATLFPAHRRLRRRHRADPLDAHQPFESLQRHAGHAHRLVRLRSSQHRLLGELRTGHAEPEPAVVLVLAPQMPTPERRFGPPTSCPAPIRGRGSCPGANPWPI